MSSVDLLSVALVGCTGTGKTSLAQSPSVCSSREGRIAPTLSTKCHEARLKSCSLHLWETPTWDLTMDPEAHFARGCDAVVFVMDCTRRQTVDEVLLHWMHVARYHCAAQAPFLFVGTKSDLAGEEAASLQSRLQKLQLPSVVGSCLVPSFALAALEELCHLCQHVGRPELPLLQPLPPLRLLDEVEPVQPAQPALPAPTVGSLFPSSETGLQAPRTMRAKAVAPKWQIAGGELTFLERLDAEPAMGGRSPSVYASWKGMPVVAKRVERSLLQRRGSEERLKHLLSELIKDQCPYMAKFHGACVDTEPVSLVMEYMPGGDLERYLRSKRLENHRPWVPPRELLFAWAVSCSSALAYLASLKVAHGNVRPSNLLLCTSLALRLSPCGALSPVEHRHQAKEDAENLDSCLYSAPEVLRGETLDEEQLILADVFALGLVLWFMCTGARPLQHLDNDGMHKPASHVMKAFKDGRMPRPRLADVTQGARMRELISQAWKEAPAERPSLPELVQALKKMEAAPDSQCCCAM